jgi:hypothetical protein
VATIDFSPPTLDLVVRLGEPEAFKVTIEEPYFSTLAGAVWAAEVRKAPGPAFPAVVEFGVSVEADGVTVTIPSISYTLLEGRSEWSGVWDLQATAADVPSTLIAGKFTVKGDVTQ